MNLWLSQNENLSWHSGDTLANALSRHRRNGGADRPYRYWA